jgi:hypothetical protein
MFLLAYLPILLLFGSKTVCAARCPCVVPPGVDDHSDSAMVRPDQEWAGAIFAGKVVGVDTLTVHRFWFPNDSAVGRRLLERPEVVRYLFAVTELWKGRVGRQAQVMVRAFSSDCGREFKLGESYLVYALQGRRELESYACLRSPLLEHATEDRRVLGRGRRISE